MYDEKSGALAGDNALKTTSDKLIVRLLGRMELSFQGRQIEYILKKAKKTRRLVAYLVLNKGAPVSVHSLYEDLWEDADIDNPESALKTLVSRTRATFAQIDPRLRDLIIAHTGAYSWNMDMTQDVDAFQVEVIADTLLGLKQDNKQFRASLHELTCLYTGKLLPEMSSDEFVLVHEMRVEDKFKSAINHAIGILVHSGDDRAVIKICRMALLALPFEDGFHIELIRALIRTNRRTEAMAQYRYVMEVNMRYFGARPSEQLQAILNEIVQADSELEKDIGIIADELTEGPKLNGAYVCDYGIFKDIYRLQVRSLDRYKVSTILVIIKVCMKEDRELQPLELDEVMKRLQESLRKSLRLGDIVTRYTATQFALLLKGTNMEYLSMIIKRIQMSFYDSEAYRPIEMEYAARKLTSEAQ